MLLGRWLKVRNWWDPIDPHVIVGAFPFARDVEKLAALGVKGVVNTCDEYPGPVAEYERFGIEQFYMPTIDFTHPSLEDVTGAVEFIEGKVGQNETVYIHCKAGRARSATVALCWLMKAKGMSMDQGQTHLLESRPHVNARLTSRPVVQEFSARLKS
jgi:atypical dual specificity phosphatase